MDIDKKLEFGKNLTACVEQAGVVPDSLADTLGISPRLLKEYMAGRYEPPRLADFYEKLLIGHAPIETVRTLILSESKPDYLVRKYPNGKFEVADPKTLLAAGQLIATILADSVFAPIDPDNR